MKRAFWFLIFCIGSPLIVVLGLVVFLPALLWLAFIDRESPYDDVIGWWLNFCRKRAGIPRP